MQDLTNGNYGMVLDFILSKNKIKLHKSNKNKHKKQRIYILNIDFQHFNQTKKGLSKHFLTFVPNLQ